MLAMVEKYGDPKAIPPVRSRMDVPRSSSAACASSRTRPAASAGRRHPARPRAPPGRGPPSARTGWARRACGRAGSLRATSRSPRSASEPEDISLVRQMLQAHAYWRLQESEGGPGHTQRGVRQPRAARCRGLKRLVDRIRCTRRRQAGRDLPPPRRAARPRGPDADPLRRPRGPGGRPRPLARRSAPGEGGELPDPLPTLPLPESPSAPLPFLELRTSTAWAGFTRAGGVRDLPRPGACTPAPWVNVSPTPASAFLVSESGSAFLPGTASQQNRLTGWSNDPVSGTRNPTRSTSATRRRGSAGLPPPSDPGGGRLPLARHGTGYTVFEHNSHAIQQGASRLRADGRRRPRPIRVQQLRLPPTTRRAAPRCRSPCTSNGPSAIAGRTARCTSSAGGTARRGRCWRLQPVPSLPRWIAFARPAPSRGNHTADRTGFLGRNGTMAAPAAMKRSAWRAGLAGAGPVRGRADDGASAAGGRRGGDLPPRAGGSIEGGRPAGHEVPRFRPRWRPSGARSGWWDRLVGAVRCAHPGRGGGHPA